MLGLLVELASNLVQVYLSFLPENGRRSSFRNVVILLKYRQWSMSKKRYYRLDLFEDGCLLDCSAIRPDDGGSTDL
jgi:hypothetical protein